MSWAKYCELDVRTESIPANTFEKTPYYNEVVTRLLHAQLGLQTEITEYQEAIDLKNKIEELGDTYWYLAVINNTIIPLHLNELIAIVPTADEDICKFRNSKHWLAEMADVLKRTIYYGEDLYEKNKKGVVPVYRFMVAYWGIIRWIKDQTMLDDMPNCTELYSMNIEKLSKRYPDLAFKPSDALTRNVENELSHIPETPSEPMDGSIFSILEVMAKLVSEEGLDITNLATAYIHVGCNPNHVKSFLELQVFQADLSTVEKHLGYSLKDYITSIYQLADGRMFLKLTAPEANGTYAQILEEGPAISNNDLEIVEDPALSFGVFNGILSEHFKSFTDLLVFGGTIFSALDNYYSEQGCLAISKAYKQGYVELMAYRPSQSKEAMKDIWAVINIWGQLHVFGVPYTVSQLHKMLNNPKSLCLCPSMLKK